MCTCLVPTDRAVQFLEKGGEGRETKMCLSDVDTGLLLIYRHQEPAQDQ